MTIYLLRGSSRGQLTLRSADPARAPLLDFNFLATEEDIRDMRACVRIARQVSSGASIVCTAFIATNSAQLQISGSFRFALITANLAELTGAN